MRDAELVYPPAPNFYMPRNGAHASDVAPSSPFIESLPTLTTTKPEETATESLRTDVKRLPWRRPMLRRMEAIDARQISKSRSRNDALHLS